MKKISLMFMIYLSLAVTTNAQQDSEKNIKSEYNMKIITIEEHFVNAEIGAAIKDEIEKIASGHSKAFVADLGSRQTMKPGQLTDIGEGRIANMDANGIRKRLSWN